MSDNAVLTAEEIAGQIRSGAVEPMEPPPAAAPDAGGGPEEPADEEFEKQWKDFEEGKGELPNSKRAIGRLFENLKKTEADIEKKFSDRFSEQEKKLRAYDLGTKAQRRYNLAGRYKAEFIDTPEKAEKDFATPEKYRAYIKQRDQYKEAYEQEIAKLDGEIKAEEAALEKDGKAGKPEAPGEQFAFRSAEDRKRYASLHEAYAKAVPGFAEISGRWAEVSRGALETIAESMYAPALLHAAIAEGWTKLPERSQIRNVLLLEAQLAERLAKNPREEPATAPEPKKPALPAPALPAPPPKMKGSGSPPREEVITAQDIAKDIREGRIKM